MTVTKSDVWRGTLALMILRTLDTLGPLHGYGIGRRIEQTSEGLLRINQGTLYPQLMKLEEDGYIRGAWGVSENGQRAKFYRLTRSGHRQLRRITKEWEQASLILDKFRALGEAP